MPETSASCVICGYFVLRNGLNISSQSTSDQSDIIIYDTKIKPSVGCPKDAKLIIAGQCRFSDGSVVCAIAKGGLLLPYGYIMQTCRLISLRSNPILYQDVRRNSRVSATGRMTSRTIKQFGQNVQFDLETATSTTTDTTRWTIR